MMANEPAFSTVTLTEDLGMALMALAMLVAATGY